MDTGQLEAFLQVATHRNFSRAAAELFLAQPSVTARIQALERELGEALFERSGRAVSLTEAGEAFLPHAERILNDVKEGRDALDALRRTEIGTLRLGAALHTGAHLLPRVLRTFRDRYPKMEVSVRTGHSDDVLAMVLSGEVQAGFCRALVHPDIESIRLFDDELVLVAGAEHPLASRQRVRKDDLAGQTVVLFDRASSYYALTQGFFRDAGVIPPQTLELASSEAAKLMVEQGVGIALLPRLAVERELALGVLSPITVEGTEPITRPITLMYRRDRRDARAIAALVEVVCELFGVDPPEGDDATGIKEGTAKGEDAPVETVPADNSLS